MNEQEMLKRRINAYKFASWELHLFLDSHPENADAAQKHREYERKIKKLTKEYEEKYGTLSETSATTSRYEWINGSWPWEVEG